MFEFLTSTKVPTLAPSASWAPAQIGERSDLAVLEQLAEVQIGVYDDAAGADAGVDDRRMRADRGPGADLGSTAQEVPGSIRASSPIETSASIQVVAGSTIVTLAVM